MYSKLTDRGWEIAPVVWVKSIDTLFYETACGSGTIALTQALALRENTAIENLAVIQPTGRIINASVIFDGKKFQYAQISGPIEILKTGLIENDGRVIDIEQIKTSQELNRGLQKGAISLYGESFKDKPYFEKFKPDEIVSFFQEYQERGILYFAWDNDKVIGFGAMLPVRLGLANDVVGQLVASTGIDPDNTWYCADLGVDKEYRKKGVGTNLVKVRLEAVKGKTVVMRTSINNPDSQSIYKSLGFKQIPEFTQIVEGRRQDGSIKPDTRIFFIKNIV
jgi:ribosomal protein S18 acetylase RimI-like enzyme